MLGSRTCAGARTACAGNSRSAAAGRCSLHAAAAQDEALKPLTLGEPCALLGLTPRSDPSSGGRLRDRLSLTTRVPFRTSIPTAAPNGGCDACASLGKNLDATHCSCSSVPISQLAESLRGA